MAEDNKKTEGLTLTPLNITAQDILNTMFNADETVCLRIFDDKKRGIFKGLKPECICSQFTSDMEQLLLEHNKEGHGIFYVVNYGGHSDEDITRINAQFVEMDHDSFEKQAEKINAFPLPPSFVIKTKKSLHIYWLVTDNPQVSRFREIQLQLVKHFDGDPMCQNESRCMRLPGFNHCKGDPVPVQVVLFHPERKYTQDELAAHLPKVEMKHLEKLKGTEKGLSIVMRECDFLKHCESDAATLSEIDWYAMITELANLEGGVEMIHKLSAGYPKYNETETIDKINHFIKSGTRPMTCRTISEKGFKCPKLETGECECKAPAALCFKPLSIEAIQELAEALPITNNTIQDMKTASDYIGEYLYSQDISIATAVINSTLKEHFKFKTTELRSLLSLYRSKHKEFESGARVRKGNTIGTLPKWYEFGEHGIKFKPGILALEMKQNERVIYAATSYYRYNDGVYEPIDDDQAQAMVQAKMLPDETKWSQIVDAERQWRIQIRREIRELNANPYLINVQNGIYDVIDGRLLEHTPDILTTIQLRVKFDENADCPRFRKFLADSMEGDMDQVALIQEMLGYFMIPVTKAQKTFLIVGAAAAGKSVLLRVLEEVLLGKENVSNISWQSLSERFKTAELFGKLANIFADLPTKAIDDKSSIFKALVGEDFVTGERKGKDPFKFQNSARLLFSCNSIPKNYDDRSEGFYRRLIIIRFNHSVPPEKRDPDLLDKFREEADGIFMFALEGLRRLISRNYIFAETEKNARELELYRISSDSVLSFVADCCTIKEGASTSSSILGEAYKKYCEENGMYAVAHFKMLERIKDAYPAVIYGERDKVSRRKIVKNIEITDNPI